MGEAQAEIKALRFSERLREKAVEEVISSFLIFQYMLFWSFSFLCIVFIGRLDVCVFKHHVNVSSIFAVS